MRRFLGSFAQQLQVQLVWLHCFGRRRPSQNFRLSWAAAAHQRLIQSFPALPRPQPPALWLQRLPQALAQRLWRNKAISWFQLWGEHAGAPPYLMLRGGADLDGLPHSLRLGHYRLVAADALSLKSLQQSLNTQTALSFAVKPWPAHHRRCFGKARRWRVGWAVGRRWLSPCVGAA